jgi:pimeloyl-ACP methyl ester carboxylesterase
MYFTLRRSPACRKQKGKGTEPNKNTVQNLRKYGKPPFSVVLVHGGPGAAGTMEGVAKIISANRGVIEAIQTRYSIYSLLVELRGVVTLHGHPPVVLIGHSWGAWLSILFASKYPDQVEKLILVASAPMEEKYAARVMETRLQRLDENDAITLSRLMHRINRVPVYKKDPIFLGIAELMRKADAFQPERSSYRNAFFEYAIYESIWTEAEKIRSSGELLLHAGRVDCPVLAIHGDYDPHPYHGVKLPLEKTIKDFRFLLLEKCGHEPWNEVSAKNIFYNILEKEI